jgi:hypothetical protein
MIDNAHVLDILFGKGNALWRIETRNEAMLLMRALYKSEAGSREKITAAILAGPPPKLSGVEGDDEEADWDIFDMLSFLESEHLPLIPEAQRKLGEIRQQNPEWKSNKYDSATIWTEAGKGPKNITTEVTTSIEPEDIPNKIATFKDSWEKSRRGFCEGIGVSIARYPEWGRQVINALQRNIETLPVDSINPILWGMRATTTDNSIKLDGNDVVSLLNKFGSVIDRHPVPSMWTSLPSLVRHLIGKYELSIAVWGRLGMRLASLFEDFDYERSEEKEPIEWHHRAINHPYGDVTELFLNLAQQHVNFLLGSEQPLSLEPQAEKFFSRVITNYNVGSRYGLCLLAQRLSWLEAVSRDFAAVLLSAFDWSQGGNRPLVAWSGYLWSNTLSSGLVERFDVTYVLAAKRHFDFASQERRGLANHVSAVFWFHPDRINLLYQFASAVDSELRLALLHGWKTHLKNAQEASAKGFFDSIVFPYWDWCERQDFFRDDITDKERFGFWELVPHSFKSFPEACLKAIQRRPSTIAHLGLFVRDAVNDSTLGYPNELTELLIAVLECDPHPQWQDKDWREGWHALKNSGAKRLTDLENALAKKGILLEGRE